MPSLSVELRNREILQVPITCVATFIGRDPSCEVRIDNAGLSWRHAVVRYEHGAFVLEDLQSQNGIFQGGERVASVHLAEGVQVQIGKFSIVFREKGGVPIRALKREEIHGAVGDQGAQGTQGSTIVLSQVDLHRIKGGIGMEGDSKSAQPWAQDPDNEDTEWSKALPEAVSSKPPSSNPNRSYAGVLGFVLGFSLGGLVGAGIALWLAGIELTLASLPGF